MSPPQEPANMNCPTGAANRQKLTSHDHELEQLWGFLRTMEQKVEKALEAALKRPGWAVLLIISVLSSACVGLLMALLQHMKHLGA